MSYIDAAGALNIGTLAATSVTIGNGTSPISFITGGALTFTGVTVANFIPPLIGTTGQIIFNNGTILTGSAGLTYTTGTTTLTVATKIVSSGVHQAGDGTVAAPGFTFTGATNYGMYNHPKAGVALSMAGIDRWLMYYKTNVVTNNTAQAVFTVSIGALQSVGLTIEYTMEGRNTTNAQTVTGTSHIMVVRKTVAAGSGIVTTVLADTKMKAAASSSGAGSCTFTVVNTSSTIITVNATPAFSFAPVFGGATPPVIILMVRSYSPTAVLTFA
jgi:hypothetical protein